MVVSKLWLSALWFYSSRLFQYLDDDVVMPEGPPPTSTNDDVVDSDDDIPMPEGPPPNNLERASHLLL